MIFINGKKKIVKRRTHGSMRRAHKNCVQENSGHVARTRPPGLATVGKNPNIRTLYRSLLWHCRFSSTSFKTHQNESLLGDNIPTTHRHQRLKGIPELTMLRLNANYPFIPNNQTRVCCNNKLGSYHDTSSIVKYGGSGRRLVLSVSVKAVEDEGSGGGSTSFPGQSWDPSSEIEVPSEQRPVNEYSSLKDGILYSWGELGPSQFFLRLGGLWLVTFTVLGVPIAAASFNPSREPLRFVLAAGTGTLFLVSLIVLRIYLGWSYVGDRLLSAVVPYEESGWYDGQMWVKPPEVLARDRLLGSYKVKPVIQMLKQTLAGTGALLVSAVLLFIFATPVEDFFKSVLSAKENLPEVSGSRTDKKFNIGKEELLSLPVDVVTDDDLAAAAAEAADGRPVYCRDRYYRALAGGQYCKWEDLLMK